MLNKRLMKNLAFSLLYCGAVSSAENSQSKTSSTLTIDIPVKLNRGNVVFNIDHLMFKGDLPIALEHIALLRNDFKSANTQGKIIAIFHTDAGHVVLEDEAYNSFRSIKTGNPYKHLIANLIDQGVQVELCGATAKAHNWVNSDLLPGVKVNTDAMARLTQLVDQGYVPIKE